LQYSAHSFLGAAILLLRATALIAHLGELQPSRARSDGDEGVAYFQAVVAGRGKPYLIAEYGRTMRFLYEKVSGQQLDHPPADLYQERGYATDTQTEANFSVWKALSVLASLEPKLPVQRILPPGTGLLDLFAPQNYQPFAVADAVLALSMATRDRLRVHCADSVGGPVHRGFPPPHGEEAESALRNPA
jgi:hypothetical protein